MKWGVSLSSDMAGSVNYLQAGTYSFQLAISYDDNIASILSDRSRIGLGMGHDDPLHLADGTYDRDYDWFEYYGTIDPDMDIDLWLREQTVLPVSLEKLSVTGRYNTVYNRREQAALVWNEVLELREAQCYTMGITYEGTYCQTQMRNGGGVAITDQLFIWVECTKDDIDLDYTMLYLEEA